MWLYRRDQEKLKTIALLQEADRFTAQDHATVGAKQDEKIAEQQIALLANQRLHDNDNHEAHFQQLESKIQLLQQKLESTKTNPIVEPLKVLADKQDVLVDILHILARSGANDRKIEPEDAERLIAARQMLFDQVDGHSQVKVSFRRSYRSLGGSKTQERKR